ncbi:hypothetical protein SDC9_63307 [bioreactor metagenome]|uniref:Uncharacterized protein n=1 Tax=bioreactor metagenome TaxID=1076179 RepID=A0A644XL62_9ZZZZ
MTGEKTKHRRHSTRSFITGMIMGAALLLGAYFTYLLATNDEQETPLLENAVSRNDSLPPLYTLTGFPKVLFDSSLQSIDSIFYRNKWDQLIAMSGYREMDSLFIDSVIRKMYFDSLLTLQNPSADTIILQNDRLLATKNVNVVVQKKIQVANDTTGVDYKYSDAHYVIEYWESPIKFRGFKRTGTHVVLFGLLPKNVGSMAQIESILYIREKQLWYSLPNTPEFSGLTPVTAPQLLDRLEAASKQK